MITSSSVVGILETQGIKACAIIDDAFDQPDQFMTEHAKNNLFEAVYAEDHLMQWFEKVGHVLKSPDDLTPAAIAVMKNLAATDADAAQVWGFVETEATSRRSALDQFASALEEELKLAVTKISAAAVEADDGAAVISMGTDVVFLDYELREGENEGELSLAITDRIHGQFAGKDAAPLVILMSSRPLDEASVAAFQRKTKVLSGMFYFVPKDELFDPEMRHYRLATLAKTLKTGRVLQQFVGGIEDALADITKKVFADVRALSIADYAFLKKLRLHDDGQPLGEYLLWLMNSHIVKELLGSTAVCSLESAVNSVSFDDLPPTQSRPSMSLATLYSSAVMRPVAALPEKAEDASTYLQFGDLFRVTAGNKVWLCVTAPCDLAFSETRSIPKKRSILFLPGKMQAIEVQLGGFAQRQPRTELIWLDGKAYRILWDTKGLVHVEWEKVHDWKTKTKVERIARLNTPFALEVQRSFASDLTRIGMPAPPPFYNPVQVALVVIGSDGADFPLTQAGRDSAYLTGGDRKSKLVLGEDFMNALPDMLKSANGVLTERLADIRTKADRGEVEPIVLANAEAALARVATAMTDAPTLSRMRGPFELPSANTPATLLENLLSFSIEVEVPAGEALVPLRLYVVPLAVEADA